MAKALQINPQAWYTLQDIVQHKMFPWFDSYHSVRKAVLTDTKRTSSILRTVSKGKGKNVRYKIKGENIIKFIKAVEAGSVRL